MTSFMFSKNYFRYLQEKVASEGAKRAKSKKLYELQKYRIRINALEISSAWEIKFVMGICFQEKICNAWSQYECATFAQDKLFPFANLDEVLGVYARKKLCKCKCVMQNTQQSYTCHARQPWSFLFLCVFPYKPRMTGFLCHAEQICDAVPQRNLHLHTFFPG